MTIMDKLRKTFRIKKPSTDEESEEDDPCEHDWFVSYHHGKQLIEGPTLTNTSNLRYVAAPIIDLTCNKCDRQLIKVEDRERREELLIHAPERNIIGLEKDTDESFRRQGPMITSYYSIDRDDVRGLGV